MRSFHRPKVHPPSSHQPEAPIRQGQERPDIDRRLIEIDGTGVILGASCFLVHYFCPLHLTDMGLT